MKIISGKTMCRLLEQKGWKLARIGNQDLKAGLQRFIMKIAAITEEEL